MHLLPRPKTPTRSTRRGIAVFAAVALAAGVAAPVLAPAAPAQAALPADVIFEEGFENTGQRPILLTSYAGVGGVQYSADAGWLQGCNGNILAGNSATSDLSATNCTLRSSAQNATAYAKLRQLAILLGEHADPNAENPAANHVLAAFTDGRNPGAGTQLRSSTVVLPGTSEGRFIGLSIDGAAMSCSAGGPVYEFSITNPVDGQNTDLGGAALCSDPSVLQTTVPALDTAGAVPVRYATVESTKATKYTGTELQAEIRNLYGSGTGNDAAVDNMRILDQTPTLTKEFQADTNTVGDTATLVFTVTNTEDRLAKDGWSFTDTLPGAMTIADPALTVVCSDVDGGAIATSAITTTSVAGSSTIDIDGSLPAGADDCTIALTVTAPAGSYDNAAGNIVSSFLKSTEMPTASATWAAPTDGPEAKTTPFNTPVTIDPFENFAAVTGDATPTTPNTATFRFSNGETTMTTVEGVWTYDPTTALITFTPAPSYGGTTPAMPYTYSDSNGNVVNSTATVTVGGAVQDLAKVGDQGQPTTVPIAAHTPDIDLTSVRLVDPTTDAAVDGPVTVPGEGTWSVDAVTGAVTFTPEPGFDGDPTPIDYTATDGTGVEVPVATITVTYPDVSDVAKVGDQGSPVTVPTALGSTIDPTTVDLVDPTTGLPTTGDVVVAGEGTWSVDAVTGAITFTPEAGFETDPTSITYIGRTTGGAQAQPATVTITYPNASDVEGRGEAGTPVTVPADLDPGVDPTTVAIIDPSTGQPTREAVIVPGEGQWAVDPTTGAITFTPEAGFTADPTPVTYVAEGPDGETTLPSTVVVRYDDVDGGTPPGTDEPGTDQPGTDQPGTEQPGTDEPGTEQPGTDEPGTDQPGTDEPGADQPGTDEPGTDQPGTEQPASEEPGADAPAAEQPGANPVTPLEPTEGPGEATDADSAPALAATGADISPWSVFFAALLVSAGAALTVIGRRRAVRR